MNSSLRGRDENQILKNVGRATTLLLGPGAGISFLAIVASHIPDKKRPPHPQGPELGRPPTLRVWCSDGEGSARAVPPPLPCGLGGL